MALAMIEAAEADGRLDAGRLGRRIHRRQHRRVAVAGLRGEGLSAAHRDLGCLRPGEARSHEDPRRQASSRAERERAHDGEADPRHDRGRPRHRGRDRRLLDRSAEQHGPARGLSHDGGGDLDADGRTDRRLRPERRDRGVASRHRGRPAPPQRADPDRRRRARRIRRCCRAARRAPTRSTASAPASSCRSGRTDIADQIEQVSTEEADGHGRCGWRGRKAFSRGPRPAPMSSPRCGWPNSWDPARPSSPSCATPG